MDTPRTVRTLLLLLPLAACMAAPLAAQYRGLSAGLGWEANGVTIFDDLGMGPVFALENRLNRRFALDFRGGASLPVSRMADLGTPNAFLGFEAQLFLRLYMLSPPAMDTPRGAELFLAAGGGLITLMNGPDARDSRGSPEASAILGLRVRIGKRFYVEPYIRGGYPFLFGGGLVAGLRFPSKDEVKTVVETVVVEKDVPRGDGAFVVFFPPNGPYFNGLSPETIEENTRTLERIAGLLKKHPSARLLIEGYANPVLGTQRESANALRPLSRRRANFIVKALVDLGVSPGRFIAVGEGGANPVVPINDRENWEKNRRVELRILW
jgi:outer membrane protein OmpA-like peptidoglycan-associated protein